MTAVSYHNADNFIRNCITICGSGAGGRGAGGGWATRGIRKTSTGGLPVSVEEILLDLHVDDPDDEAETVERLAHGACDFIERRTGFVLRPSTFELVASSWPTSGVEIVRTPLREIAAVEYLEDRDTWAAVAASESWTSQLPRSFVLRFLPGFSRPSLWQPEDSVRVRFAAGFDAVDETGGDLPIEDGLRTILLMITGHYYRNREMLGAADARNGVEAVELGATSLLGQYRMFW